MIETIDLTIKIFTIVGSFAGLITFYFMFIEHRRKKPIIECLIEHAFYEVIKKDSERKGQLMVKPTFVIHNKGSIGSTITGCMGYVRYHRSIAKGIFEPVIEGETESNNLPIHIKPDCSTKFELTLHFKTQNNEYYLDRCMMPIDIHNPKKWDWNDLPIIVKFMFKHTKGKFEIEDCIFRKDQSQSKEKNYFYPLEVAKGKFDFYPKSPKNESVL